jgi:hypothetical protein
VPEVARCVSDYAEQIKYKGKYKNCAKEERRPGVFNVVLKNLGPPTLFGVDFVHGLLEPTAIAIVSVYPTA